MKCHTVQNLYLSYIDKELSENEISQIHDHLSNCSDCVKKADALCEIYQPGSRVQKVEPSPFMWQKLYLKISEQEKKVDTFIFSEKLIHYAANFGVVVILIMSVLFGIYLGSSPNLANTEIAAETSNIIVSDEFENDSYITTFDDLPRKSIAGVYLTMEME